MSSTDAPPPASGPDAPIRYLAGWLAGALPAFAMITLLWLYPGPSTPFGIVALGAYALGFPVMVRRLGIPRRPEFVAFLLLAGLVFGVVSILTGWANGLTDEGFTTPHFAGFLLAGHDPYTTAMTFAYIVYGKHVVSTSYYVYLPLLMFLQVPGFPYKGFSLACWAATVLVVRRRFDAATMLGQPYVMLVAANGYNDPVVLLLLTIGLAGVEGHRSKWAEWLALGCKQFANVFVLAYYAVRRDWRNLLATACVSAAFIVPFLLWGGTAVVCPALLANRPASCPHTGGIQLLINYPVWPVWVVAVFYGAAYAGVRSALARPRPGGWLGRRRWELTQVERLPSVVVVGASAVVTGLGAFVLAGVCFGGEGWATIASGAIAAPAAVGWGCAWGGPWALERGAGPVRSRAVGRFLGSQLVIVVIDLALLSVWTVARGPPLTGEAVGLTFGTGTGYGLLFAWKLVASAEPRGESVARGIASP